MPVYGGMWERLSKQLHTVALMMMVVAEDKTGTCLEQNKVSVYRNVEKTK